MNCEFCQSPVHIWFQCPKKPDGWKPARLAKKSTGAEARAVPNQHGSQVAQKVEQGDASVIARGSYVAGSIPALPVDTNSLNPVEWSAGPQLESRVQPAPGAVPTPGTKFDKKAWMRKNMPAYMRKYRADVKSGKRVPKKREC